jgi:tRNA_anti-like
MSITRVTCPRCSRRFPIPHQDANQTIVCRSCGTWFHAAVAHSPGKSRGRFHSPTGTTMLALIVFTGLACIALRSVLFPAAAQAPPPKLEDPVKVLSVGELFADLQKHGADAEKTYVGKVLRVTGSVARLGKAPSGARVIDLFDLGQNQVFTVRCEFRHGDWPADVHQEDLVAIDGRCRSTSGVVLLEDCELRPQDEANPARP